jgi:hypothetical protein
MIEPLGVLLAHHHGLELVNLVVDFHMFVKHCLDFSFVFSAPLPAWRNLISLRGIFCGGRYQLKVPASLSLCLKSEKTPALLHLRKDLSTGPSSILKLQYLSLGFKQGVRSQKDPP